LISTEFWLEVSGLQLSRHVINWNLHIFFDIFAKSSNNVLPGEPPHPNVDNNTVYGIIKAEAIPPPYFIFRLTVER